jgi:hypothetical protein
MKKKLLLNILKMASDLIFRQMIAFMLFSILSFLAYREGVALVTTSLWRYTLLGLMILIIIKPCIEGFEMIQLNDKRRK